MGAECIHSIFASPPSSQAVCSGKPMENKGPQFYVTAEIGPCSPRSVVLIPGSRSPCSLRQHLFLLCDSTLGLQAILLCFSAFCKHRMPTSFLQRRLALLRTAVIGPSLSLSYWEATLSWGGPSLIKCLMRSCCAGCLAFEGGSKIDMFVPSGSPQSSEGGEMDRTHVMNTYVMLSVPSVGKEAKCLTETDSGQAALGWAVREAWDGTAQPRWAGQGKPDIGSVLQVGGAEGADLRQEIKEWGKCASGLQGCEWGGGESSVKWGWRGGL